MGMDVSGKNPTSETGAYFRNNVWWWRPLWNYCCAVAPKLTCKVKYGQTNDGDGLNGDDSKKLAAILQAEIDSGRCAQYEQEYKARLATLPKQKCEFCDGSGVRRNEADNRNGVRDSQGPNGKTGACNGCNGSGERPRLETCYPFSTENVQEFVAFLRDCGGFEIW